MFASYENCSIKFFGMKVKTLYLDVTILLFL